MSPTPTTFHSRSLLKTIQMIMPAADARGRVDSRDASSLSAFKLPEPVASDASWTLFFLAITKCPDSPLGG